MKTPFRDLVDSGPTPYDKFLKKEGLPVIRGYFVDDILRLELKPWKRVGANGCYLNLGDQQENDAYVCEIPAAGETLSQRHLFEAIIYIAKGRGATAFWPDDASKVTMEWSQGAAFAVPLNVRYKHFNLSKNEPVRFLAATNLPRMLNLFHNEDFIFKNSFSFQDRLRSFRNYLRGGHAYRQAGRRLAVRRWEADFIPDVNAFPLDEYPMKGKGVRIMRFTLAESTYGCHIQEFPAGSRSLFHRHGPGALITVTKGEGYVLLWRDGEEKKRYDFRAGSVYSPGNLMFHGHFNTGPGPMRHFAVRGASPKYTLLDRYPNPLYQMISPEEEPPEIHKAYLEELARKGVETEPLIVKE